VSERLKIKWEFHPKQKALWDSLRRGEHDVYLANAGRRSGKGKLGARAAWLKAYENPGEQIMITATTYPQLKDIIKPNMDAEMPPGFAVYKETKKDYECVNGATVMMRSVDNPEPLRGFGEFTRFYWGDEFALYPQKIWDEILSFALLDNDVPALLTSTPKGMNKFYQFYMDWQNGDKSIDYHHWTSFDNPWLSDKARAKLAEYPEGIKRQEVYAEFLDDLGGVFTGVRKCIAGDLEGPQDGETYVVGCDLAKTQDFTVVVVINRRTRAVVGFERFSQLDWEFQVAKVQAAALRYHNATLLLDSTGLGDPVYDRLRSLGVPVKGYKFTAESKRRLVENLSLAISQGTIRYPDIPELINELNIYAVENLPSGGVRYGAPQGYHDDCVIALALACWGLGRGGAMPLIVGGTTDGIERPSYKPAL
jgi:phage terminase large subunit-like protein